MKVKGIGARIVEINEKTFAGDRGVKVQVSSFVVAPDSGAGFLAGVWSIWHMKI